MVPKTADAAARAPASRIHPTAQRDDPGSPLAPASRENASSLYHPGKVDIFFLGLAIVMCGQYMGWNTGLSAGVSTFLICFVVMALGYVAFCLCVAEVTGALPFAGGAYGLARCTLGFFPAFLIGCAEALEYICCAAFAAVCIGDIIGQVAPSLERYKPALWFLVYYLPATILQCVGGTPFWRFSTALSATQLGLLVVYCVGVLRYCDFDAYALGDSAQLYDGGLHGAMAVFPFAAWFFMGVEALNLASDDVKKPKTTIPVAQISCIGVLVAMGLFTLLTTVALPIEGGLPALATAVEPLATGFALVFSSQLPQILLLTLPSQYAGAFGFSWAATKLLHSLGSSRLLPPSLAATSSRFRTPHVAIIAVSVLGYCICLLIHFVPSVSEYLLPLCFLFAFTSYAGQCVGYISLRLNYPVTKQSSFKNPLGIVGAAYALVVWLVAIVGIVGFQGHQGAELGLYCALMAVLGVYYLLVAKRRQIMSEEESKVLLVAHIMRFNAKKKRRHAPGSSSASQSAKTPSKPSKRHASGHSVHRTLVTTTEMATAQAPAL